MAPDPKLKRKASSAAPQAPGSRAHDVKRVRLNDARNIRAQTSVKALNEHGELDVAAFVKAHEYELKALEKSMGESKKVSSSRAFQQVPRELRRRTASHNVKKVPKRLRSRAAREMREDNTPTVTARRRELSGKQRLRRQVAKDKIAGAGKAGASEVAAPILPKTEAHESVTTAPVLAKKFKKRQIHKSWLPTHLYHTKRAHMTPPQSPLWRFAIPLTPTDKSYRPVHRASTLRGCVAWDMSYISSIGIKGRERSLLGLLRSMAVPEADVTGANGKKWRDGLRSWSGWLRERDGDQNLISKVEIVWNPKDGEEADRSLLVRVHPSAFLQLWEEFLKVAKIQKPAVKVEDLRFELGSIEISGPAATEALVKILKPVDGQEEVSRTWPRLASLTNPCSLPLGAVLGFAVADTRLGQPHQRPASSLPSLDERILIQDLLDWPIDREARPYALLSSKARSDACRLLPSQKSINRRKGEALAGSHPSPLPTDPKIPILVLAKNHSSSSHSMGSWTVILPWKCVPSTWYSLMHCPLSGGGSIQLGGLLEQRQVHFENNTPWFPADYPGTAPGWRWELQEREERRKSWEKRPKGKRIEWESLDLGEDRKGELGHGWACDWEALFESSPKAASSANVNENTPSPISEPPLGMHHIVALPTSSASGDAQTDPRALLIVSICLIRRGNAGSCARIYRLPTDKTSLRSAWLAQASTSSKSTLKPIRNKPRRCGPPPGSPTSDSRATLAASLLPPPSAPNAADISYPLVPGKEDLVGFITSGNYNLGQGRATGIGSISLAKILECAETKHGGGAKGKAGLGGLCIIREAGMAVGRLARWEAV